VDKQSRLEKLKKKMATDKGLPLRETDRNLVFGEGPADAKLYFLGEAPGRKEDEIGPPNNRDPLTEEIAAFAPYVDEEIKIISPKVVVTLGRFSFVSSSRRT